jgi:NADH dehydrogenase/NADH:ubiquinone oxidoreductase subunit G
MITLTINDKEVSVPEGNTVLEAAKELDIQIPTLCYEPRLKPYGGCRLCIVEIEGIPRPVTACTTPAVEGMVVKTESDHLYRRN